MSPALLDNTELFFKMFAPIYTPTACAWEVQLFHILFNTWHCHVFWVSPIWWVCSSSSCYVALNLFVWLLMRLNIFSYDYWPFGFTILWGGGGGLVAKSCLTLCNPLSVGFSRQEYWSGLPFPSSVLWGYLFKSFPHFFFLLGCLSFPCWFVWVLYIFWIPIIHIYMSCKYILLFCILKCSLCGVFWGT